MAKKNENQIEGEVVEQKMTVEIQKAIDDMISQKKMIDVDNEAYNEQAAAIAERLGIKPAALKRRVGIIIKEEAQGGEVKSKESDIEFTEQYFAIKHKNENGAE